MSLLNRSRLIRHCACIGVHAGIVAFVTATMAVQAIAATVETDNFLVSAVSSDVARVVAETAEGLRASLARDWLGRRLDDWTDKCLVTVDCERTRLGGDTTYSLVRGDVARWRIDLRGPLDRILETLVPHEVLHTVLATHFRDAVPRWADEGAAMSVEAPHEQDRLWKLLGDGLLRQPRRPLAELFAIDSYPESSAELRAFYLQGAAVTQFLLAAGKPRFVGFIGAGKRDGWERAVQDCYGFRDVAALDAAWTAWLLGERTAIVLAEGQLLSQAFADSTELTLAGNTEQAASR